MTRLFRLCFVVALLLLLVSCAASADGIGRKKGSSPIRLNEVDCTGKDWVELVNTGAASYEIGDWVLTDSLEKRDHLYRLPSGTTLTAGQHWVIKKAGEAEAGFAFGIKCAVDTVYLLDSSLVQMDSTLPKTSDSNHTWARYPDANGEWQAAFPTAGSANLLSSATPEALFSPTLVSRIDLTLDAAALAALNADPYTYVAAGLSAKVGEMEVKNQRVGLRLKSGKSFEPLSGKASFKIKATSYTAEGRLFGLKGLTLNNMVQDPSMMHETLAYRLFRAYGIAAPRSGYAWVTLNGADVGLELVLEPYDDQFDLEHFASTKHLYEGVADLCAQGAESFEIEDGATDERSDLDALIAAATAEVTGTGETWLSVLGLVADINEMADFWAIEHFIGHTDGYSLAANNYFLHSTAGEVFTLHPWGTDRCFVETPSFGRCTSVLCATCLAADSCLVRYRQARNTLPAVLAQLDFPSLIDEIQSALAASIAADTRKPYGINEQVAAKEAIKTYLSGRLQSVAAP